MGLDNGIQVITKKVIKDRPPWIYTYGTPAEYYYEFLYWRKWWGYRNEVIDYFISLGYSEEDGSFPLRLEDIIEMYRIFLKYTDRDYWLENADSVWSYEEVDFEQLEKQFLYLMAFYIANPTERIIFYDSY